MICKTCKIDKLEDNFYRKTSTRFFTECKACCGIRRRNRYKNGNKEEVLKKCREWNKLNRQRKKENDANWRKKNPDKVYKSVYKYVKKKIKTDPIYKFLRNTRNRLRSFVRTKNWRKDESFLKIIGCSKEEFIKYIENQFELGMNWNNYGYRGWHLDHHLPLANAKTIEEVKDLCHYTNLKPLWGVDNMKKNKKPPID